MSASPAHRPATETAYDLYVDLQSGRFFDMEPLTESKALVERSARSLGNLFVIFNVAAERDNGEQARHTLLRIRTMLQESLDKLGPLGPGAQSVLVQRSEELAKKIAAGTALQGMIAENAGVVSEIQKGFHGIDDISGHAAGLLEEYRAERDEVIKDLTVLEVFKNEAPRIIGVCSTTPNSAEGYERVVQDMLPFMHEIAVAMEEESAPETP